MTATTTPGPRRGATLFIFVTVILDTMALGLIVPVLPKLISGLGGGGAAGTATVFGLFATAFAVMQFLISPVQGALSDRFGRRPIILASNLGLGVDYVIMALAPNLGWLLAGRVLSGIAAGSAPAAYAYIADVTPPDRRAQRFGLMFAAQAVGAALGPALGGLLSDLDLRAPFWAAAALSLTNALFGVFVLTESLPPGRQARLDWSQFNPFGALAWLLRAHPQLAGMVVVAFLLSLASQGVNSIAVLYSIYRYHWTPRDIGILLTVFGIASLGVQALLVSTAERVLGARGAMIGSLALTILGLLVFGFASTGFQFSLAVPLLALGAISGPMMAGYFSRSVGENEQGRLQGAWSSVNGMMGLVAPGLFTFVFARSISTGGPSFPGLGFIVAAAMIAVAVGLAALTRWEPRLGRSTAGT
jgi:MFS transporter, DHA1 family, tetracycline resistance protein